MAKNKMGFYLDLFRDITENNLGYRIACQSQSTVRVHESRGFLRLESPEEYNRTAGDYIPNDL